MLAIIYLFVMSLLGDSIGRRYYPFVSVPHRLASAFLCGLLVSSWWTYLLAYFFAGSASPMFWGNVLFFITAAGAIYWLRSNPPKNEPVTTLDLSDSGFLRWDWAIAGFFLLFATWMMYRTFTMEGGNIMIGHHQFPDFGSTLSIMQSFALGQNFPTQYPHFTGERIRYHFLFYFQAGNLEYLGLSPATANNILSIFSLTSLLVLVMTLGTVLFRSRVAGRIGAILFFFHGSLSFIPFLKSQESFAALLDKLNTMTPYLVSGFPYRGEEWGVWSQNVYLNQRHLTSSIGIFLLVAVYLAIRYREKQEEIPLIDTPSDIVAVTNAESVAVSETEAVDQPIAENQEADEDLTDSSESTPVEETALKATRKRGRKKTVEPEDAPLPEPDALDTEENGNADESSDDEDEESEGPDLIAIVKQYSVFIFSGLLLGLLPMWNGAIFLGAALVLGMFLILFPMRRELIALAITAAVVSLPQVIYLKTGNVRPVGYSMFRWGFVIDNAGLWDVLYYTFFTFGFKWVLLAIALYFASGLQRKFMLAVSILLPLTYCFRFSEEVLANHKFINMWLIIVNIFCGYALFKLWHLKTGPTTIPSRVVAVILLLLITIGGAIDLMPIKNSYFIQMKYDDDRLIEWVKANTDPHAIFLSHRYINHQILLAGRRLFYGDPYYAWGADYDTGARDVIAKTMLESKDVGLVYKMLRDNNISYVAIDDQIRKNKVFVQNPNEDMYAKNFEVVFTDDINEYANLKVYKIPDTFTPPPSNELPATSGTEPAAAAANAFQGIEGRLPGQFAKPRGITVDKKGIIYVADTGNTRVQKFNPDGTFISAFSTSSNIDPEGGEPNGVAVDEAGNIFVTDAKYHKLLKFQPDGKFIKEWTGPESKFYGPRDIVFGPNKLLYIIDQGGTRIVKFDPATEAFTSFGSAGAGDGQFNEPTGITITSNMVIVADMGNNRLEFFDLEGKFLKQWEVTAWERFDRHFPDTVYDEVTKTLFVSSGKTNEVLAYDLDGKPMQGFKAEGDLAMINPSSLAINENGKVRQLLVLNTGKATLSSFELVVKKGK